MKKSLFFIFINILLLTSCNTSSKPSFDSSKLENPNDFYMLLNTSYNDFYLDYQKETKGKIVSSSNQEIYYHDLFLKNYRTYYKETNAYSNLFGKKGIQRYEDYVNDIFGVALSDELNLNENNNIQSENFSSFEYYIYDDYLNEFGLGLNNVLDIKIYEGYEKLSFKSSKLEKEGTNYKYTFELNTESKLINNKKDPILANYSSINSMIAYQNYYENFFTSLSDSSQFKFLNASIIINFDTKNLAINNVLINHEFKISHTTFNANYESTYKIKKADLSFDDSINKLKKEIDKNIEESGANQTKELYDAFKKLNDKYKTIDYYSTSYGQAIALGGVYTQTIQGYKLKHYDNYFFTNVTTSSFVKKAESRFHNITENIYKIGDGNNPTSDNKFGKVSSWNKMKDYSKDEYLNVLGHTMDEISNYILDQNDISKSFISASTLKEDNLPVYRFNMSFKEDKNHIDSTKNYKIEMNHMSNMGLPEFKKVVFKIYLSEDKSEIIKTVAEESYETGGFSINASLETKYYRYSSLNEVPKDITTTYQELIPQGE